MTKKQKSAKRAFIRSFLSFVLCFTMFAGTTYAWYNDSVTSGRNTIVSGSLDILIQRYIGTDGNFATESNWEEVTGTTPVFDETDGALTFEPGAAQVAYVRVKNNGDLAFKYGLSLKVYEETAGINQAGETFKLSDFLKFGQKAVGAPYEKSDAGRTAAIGQVSATATKLNADAELAANATLQKGATSDIIALVIYMPEDTENEANPQPDHKPSISIGLNALATQYTVERDSFSDQYDAAATMPDGKTDTVNGTVDTNGAVTLYADAPPAVDSGKQTKVEFPTGSLTSGDEITLTVDTEDVPPASTFSVDENLATVATIDLTLMKGNTEITEFNGQAITVTTYIAPGLDPTKISVVYTGSGAQPTDVTYDATTGKLTFKTTHFSEYVVTSSEVCAYNTATKGFYETLQDAFAQSGDVLLLKSIVATNPALTVAIGQTNTLDLNGYTISATAEYAATSAVISNNGTLTINDSVGTGTITNKVLQPDTQSIPSYASNTITNCGTLTINGGSFVNEGTGAANYCVDNNNSSRSVNCTINGGTFYHYASAAIRMFCNGTTTTNTLTINDGVFEGYGSIWMQGPNANANKGYLTINGGTFKTTEKAVVNGEKELCAGKASLINCQVYVSGGYASNYSSDSFVKITGGTFNENIQCYMYSGNYELVDGTLPKLEISGGTFNGYVYANANASVTGGTYVFYDYQNGTTTWSDMEGDGMIADGYKIVDNGNGTFSVVAE